MRNLTICNKDLRMFQNQSRTNLRAVTSRVSFMTKFENDFQKCLLTAQEAPPSSGDAVPYSPGGSPPTLAYLSTQKMQAVCCVGKFVPDQKIVVGEHGALCNKKV
jgi:hypothetical protein